MPARSVAGMIEQAITAGRKRVIRIPDIIYDVRRKIPACEHTDEELAALVASIAVMKGCDLSFESGRDFSL